MGQVALKDDPLGDRECWSFSKTQSLASCLLFFPPVARFLKCSIHHATSLGELASVDSGETIQHWSRLQAVAQLELLSNRLAKNFIHRMFFSSHTLTMTMCDWQRVLCFVDEDELGEVTAG